MAIVAEAAPISKNAAEALPLAAFGVIAAVSALRRTAAEVCKQDSEVTQVGVADATAGVRDGGQTKRPGRSS